MSKLHFLNPVTMDEVDAIGKRDVIVENIALSASINIIWAKAGKGKTSWCFALASACCDQKCEVAYIDVDNGVYILKERGYDKIIRQIETKHGKKFHYVNGDMLTDPTIEIPQKLDEIKSRAAPGYYKNCVFFLDSLKFFLGGNSYDESKINKLVLFSKAVRSAGGSVWILNHSLKNGADMKGAGTLTDAVDEQWELEPLGQDDNDAHYRLTPSKYRMPVKEMGLTVDRKTLKMRELDVVIASMTDAEKEFCDKAKAELQKEALPQGDLLARLGKEKADRTALDWLDKHTGRFWQHSKKGKTKIYEKI